MPWPVAASLFTMNSLSRLGYASTGLAHNASLRVSMASCTAVVWVHSGKVFPAFVSSTRGADFTW